MALTKGSMSWNRKIFLQNLRYRHNQNIEIPKYKLAYKDFYHEIFLFRHQSENLIRQCLTAKLKYERSLALV